MRVTLVKHNVEGGRTGQREVGTLAGHGGIGELQLTAHFNTKQLSTQVTSAGFKLLTVVSDQSLFCLVLVVHNEELGSV